jgi:hypothetical protein
MVYWRTGLAALLLVAEGSPSSCKRGEGLVWCKSKGECIPRWDFGECRRWASIKGQHQKLKAASAAAEEVVAAAELNKILQPSLYSEKTISVC